MRRLGMFLFSSIGVLAPGPLVAANAFTPLEWQQVVEKHSIRTLEGQRKHTNWIRDRNRNFIDDEIERRFRPGDAVDVIVDLNRCLAPNQIRALLAPFGRMAYVAKFITAVTVDKVRFDDLAALAARPEVAMIEWQTPDEITNDVSSRAIQARASTTFSPNTAQDAGFTGTGVNIAILDTGVDNNHQAFAGRAVAGFNAAIYEDTNANGQDDSCEPAPVGNGVCTDADDEPGNGTNDPADDQSHGSHVAGIALGGAVAGVVCSNPDDGSLPTNCAGVAPAAGLVDVRVCTGTACPTTNQMEGLDWIVQYAQTFNIRVANMSLGGCVNDDGTSARAQQVNYAVAMGISMVVAHGNAVGSCGVAGTQMTGSPGSASFAITVGATNDLNTIARGNDTNYTLFLQGPRTDFNVATPNLLALKPDITAPGENILSVTRLTANGYSTKSGTSMAAPAVAGAAALVRQARPAADPGSVKDLLKRTADTSLNTAQFAAVDPLWDDDLGSGMVNVGAAVAAATAVDVRFPNCVGPPAVAGQPCQVTPPLPSWNNNLDISTTTAPKVGVQTTFNAQVRNDGAAPATVLVSFGVYVFAAGNNQFFHIGTQQVTIPAGMTVTVAQNWTPAASNHQCVQVSIDFGNDTNYGNNVTQRNLQVAPSVYEVQIENPLMVPARIEIVPKSSRDGWRCAVDQDSFTLQPFYECPRTVKVTFNAPRGARIGDRANCDVAVYATPEGAGAKRLIGGVTVQTFVPKPCRAVGLLLDRVGRPIARATIRLVRETGGGAAAAVRSDENGVFIVPITPAALHTLQVRTREGEAKLSIRPDCGRLTLRLDEKGLVELQ